jgi:hypothetical protein
MSTRSIQALLGVLLLSASAAVAQEQLTGPPPVLVIGQEEIKPGSMGAHEKQVASYLALFNRANVRGSRLGLVPVSGDDNQILYLEGYASFADLEATRNKSDETFAAAPALQAELDTLDRQTGPMHATQKTLIAVYRPDLSYRPLGTDAVGKSRYFSVTTNRLKPGRYADYEEYAKQLNRAREKANLNEHVSVYQVVTGATTGTFVTFTASRSLSEWDDFSRAMPARNKAIDEALGGDVVAKQRRDSAETIFVDTRSSLYAFSPKISRPSPQIVAADPDFWGSKPAVKLLAMKTEIKKEAKEAKQ